MKKKMIILFLCIFLTACSKGVITSSEAEPAFVVITLPSDQLDGKLHIRSFDENGTIIEDQRLKFANAWHSLSNEQYIAVFGSSDGILLLDHDLHVSEIYTGSEVTDVAMSKHKIYFNADQTIEKRTKMSVNKVCSLKLEDGRNSYHEDDFTCGNVAGTISYSAASDQYYYAITSDINENGILNVFDEKFNLVDQIVLDERAELLGAENDQLLLSCKDHYVEYPKMREIPFVQKDAYVIHEIKQNQYLSADENGLYLDTIENHHLQSESLGQTSYDSGLHSFLSSDVVGFRKNHKYVGFFDLKNKECLDFSFEIPDDEIYLGSYALRR